MAVGDALLKVKILADSSQAISEMAKTEKRFGGLGKSAGLAAGGIAGAIAVVGLAAIKLGKDSVQAASAQDDAFDHMGVTFGKNSGKMQKWAKDAAKNYGLTSSEAGDMATKLGNKLRGIGTPLDKTTSQTQSLAARAVDMASAYGGTAADAVQALTNAMSGQVKGLKAYGVSITKSDIAAQRSADHTSKLTGEAGKQAEAQAILTLAYKKTANAQGAYNDNSGDLASQQEKLGAEMTNLKATIGTALLPIFQKLAQFALDKLLPALESLWKMVGPTLIKGVQGLADIFTNTLVPALSAIWSWIATNIMPIFRTIAGFITTSLVPAFSSIGDSISGKLPSAMSTIQGLIPAVVSAFKIFWTFITTSLVPALANVWTVIVTKLVPAYLSVAATVVDQLLPVIKNLVTIFVTKWLPAIKQIVTVFSTKVLPIIVKVATFIFGSLIPFLLKLVSIIAANVVPILKNILTPVFAAVQRIIDKVSKATNENRDKFAKLAPIIDVAKKAASGIWDLLKVSLVPILTAALEVVKALAKAIGITLGAAFDTIGTALSAAITTFGYLAEGIGAVVDAVTSLIQWLKKLHFPKIPKLSSLNPFSHGKAAGQVFVAPSATAPRGLLAGSRASVGVSGSGGITINVNGALDPVAVARQLRLILNRADVRNGTRISGGTGWSRVTGL